jgi:hypothetical protein
MFGGMKGKGLLSIVVPAYNEERTNGMRIRSVRACGKRPEPIVVDEGIGTGPAGRVVRDTVSPLKAFSPIRFGGLTSGCGWLA